MNNKSEYELAEEKYEFFKNKYEGKKVTDELKEQIVKDANKTFEGNEIEDFDDLGDEGVYLGEFEETNDEGWGFLIVRNDDNEIEFQDDID